MTAEIRALNNDDRIRLDTHALRELDRELIWHPYSPAHPTLTPDLPLVIQRAKGASLYDAHGREYIDMMSSWWVNLHGHCHPAIATAIYEQALQLEHVMFADITHEPALQLVQGLKDLLPAGLQKFFFSDNGSTAVEAALKILFQYWQIKGETQRNRYIAFDGGYHGDTIGAMSLGRGCGFFDTFQKLMFDVDLVPYPATWDDDPDVEHKEDKALSALHKHLEQHHRQTVGMVMEPLIQGASGMRMTRPTFVKQIVDACHAYNVPVIFDEVMTGFGRTGRMWACETAEVTPDILCLSKGLTGGFLPLSLTICHEAIAEPFQGTELKRAFLHGHTYTANPLACAAGLASLELFRTERTLASIQRIEQLNRVEAQILKTRQNIQHVRTMGPILAFEYASGDPTYGSAAGQSIKQAFFERGFIVRPLGSTVFFLPPACLTTTQHQGVFHALYDILGELDGTHI